MIRKLSAASIVIILHGSVFGFSASPPNGMANNPPAYNNCTFCHSTYTVNSGNGSFSIEGLPEFYESGQSYTFSIELEDLDQRKWGFEIAALTENLINGGTLVITDPDHTQLATLSRVDYVKQTSSGSYSGTVNASPGWEVSWTAPAAGTGTVTFYGSGNAANQDNSNQGDYIYTLEKTVDEIAPPPDPVEYLVISIEDQDVILTWPEAAGAAGYNIYRSADPYFTAGGTPYGTVTGISFTDAGALTGGGYFYMVTAVN